MTKKKNQLDPTNFGLSFGTVTAVSLLLLGLSAWLFGIGNGIVEASSYVHLGYEATFVGSLIGTFWGFVDGFVVGFLLIWLYNWFGQVRKK